MQYMEAQDVQYQRNAIEWEILGNLSIRLHEIVIITNCQDDAKEAFRKSLEKGFSAPVWISLLDLYVSENKPSHAINAISKLLEYDDDCYQSLVFPNPINIALFSLIKTHGMAKIRSTVVSMNFPPRIQALFSQYFIYTEQILVTGYDY